MAIDFPDSPSNNDIYTVNGKRWIYSNGKWSIYGSIPIDTLNVDSGLLYTDTTNNRVGINNTSPTTALDVTGDINLSGNITVGGSYVGLSSDAITDADGDTKIQVEESADEDTIRFDTAGIERMTIGSTGLVSISGDLTVSGTISGVEDPYPVVFMMMGA